MRMLPTGLVVALLTTTAVVTAAPAAHAGDTFQVCRRIHADAPWMSTAIRIRTGDQVCVEAQGLWSHGAEAGDITPFYGPAGYVARPDLVPQPTVPWQYARQGALLGRIGDGPADIAFPIGDRRCFVAVRPGDLFLGINDVPGSFDDNEGVIAARISVRRTDAFGADLIAASLVSIAGEPLPASSDERCFP